MYEVVVKVMGKEKDIKVRSFVEADALPRAAKLAEEAVREKTRMPLEAISAKQAEGPVVLLRSGEKPQWLHVDDMKDAAGQTQMDETK